jgi:hypothetical protein
MSPAIDRFVRRRWRSRAAGRGVRWRLSLLSLTRVEVRAASCVTGASRLNANTVTNPECALTGGIMAVMSYTHPHGPADTTIVAVGDTFVYTSAYAVVDTPAVVVS